MEQNNVIPMGNPLNLNKDNPPIDCDCGSKFRKQCDVKFQDGIVCEYTLRCAGCGKYLGTYEYGHWSF